MHAEKKQWQASTDMMLGCSYFQIHCIAMERSSRRDKTKMPGKHYSADRLQFKSGPYRIIDSDDTALICLSSNEVEVSDY